MHTLRCFTSRSPGKDTLVNSPLCTRLNHRPSISCPDLLFGKHSLSHAEYGRTWLLKRRLRDTLTDHHDQPSSTNLSIFVTAWKTGILSSFSTQNHVQVYCSQPNGPILFVSQNCAGGESDSHVQTSNTTFHSWNLELPTIEVMLSICQFAMANQFLPAKSECLHGWRVNFFD